MPISGFATAEQTAVFSAHHPQVASRLLGKTELTVSEVGFGSYRVDSSIAHHRQALTLALQSGINLIDTSSNYSNGGSERLIGEVLSEQIGAGIVLREQMVVVSKVGYAQGDNFELLKQRKAAGRPFPNVVKYAEGLDHCIHPEFIADQLTRSLQRLDLETIDVYLLHNPEYYLMWAARAHIDKDEARRTFYQRIRLAFEQLEQEVANGRIRSYGISANTFPISANDPTFVSFTTCHEIAESVAKQSGQPHHFHVIQFPMNLFETGGSEQHNQTGQQSLLSATQNANVGVLINRPLNASRDNVLLRLADVPPPNYPAQVEDVSTAVDSSIKIETHFRSQILPPLPIEADSKKLLSDYLSVGSMLQGNWQGFGSFQNWQDLYSQYLVPRAQQAATFLVNSEAIPDEVGDWVMNNYVPTFNTTLEVISAFYQSQAATESLLIRQKAAMANSNWVAETLSQTAVRALRSTAGVSCVLVGMRQPAYVQEMLADLKRSIAPTDQQQAFRTFRQLTQSSQPS